VAAPSHPASFRRPFSESEDERARPRYTPTRVLGSFPVSRYRWRTVRVLVVVRDSCYGPLSLTKTCVGGWSEAFKASQPLPLRRILDCYLNARRRNFFTSPATSSPCVKRMQGRKFDGIPFFSWLFRGQRLHERPELPRAERASPQRSVVAVFAGKIRTCAT